MNRKLYRKIAKEHGVSVKEVKEGINEAIDCAYKNPNDYALKVPRKGEKPTADELIKHLAQEATFRKNGENK